MKINLEKENIINVSIEGNINFYILDENNKPKKVSHGKYLKWFNSKNMVVLRRSATQKKYRSFDKAIKYLVKSVFVGQRNGKEFMFINYVSDCQDSTKDTIEYRYETYEQCLKDHDRLVKQLEKETKKNDTTKNE